MGSWLERGGKLCLCVRERGKKGGSERGGREREREREGGGRQTAEFIFLTFITE